MDKEVFDLFYNSVVRQIGNRFIDEHKEFSFNDSENAVASLYEEYLNQKTILRNVYNKKDKNHELLDRHKVCACITVAIIKVRPLSKKMVDDIGYTISSATRVNEQLAFLSAWELFKGFLKSKKDRLIDGHLPSTYHNASFEDTITRSLYFSNQLNVLSTPLIANIFFLIERYSEAVHENVDTDNF